jgi:hypothetical protein
MKKISPILIIAAALIGGVAWYFVYASKDSGITAHDTTSVKIYLYNADLDQGPGGAQCSEKGLVARERILPKTSTPLQDTLELLLSGDLSVQEKSLGISSEFPLPRVTLETVEIVDSVAMLTFSDPESKTSGGSCRVAILRAQIEATARQFDTVKSVRILPEEIFQP